jgi:hypothetical protein
MKRLYLPTRSRGPGRQVTYQKIVPAIRGDFQLVITCHHSEAQPFKDAGYEVIAHAETNLGDVRQFVVNQHTGDPRVVMVDDDFNNWATRITGTTHYKKATPEEILNGFNRLFDNLEVYANAGIGPRLFANNRPDVEYCSRVNGVVGYRKDILDKHLLRFVPLPEDLDMTIQLLKHGYSSCTDFQLVFDQSASNAAGGCSDYRTLEFHNHHQTLMYERHKPYTRLVKKTTKGGWFDGVPRIENIILWNKLVRDFNPRMI